MDIIDIPLTRGYHATIDAEDAALVAPYRWHAKVIEKLVYAATNVPNGAGGWRHMTMHQLLCGSQQVDHADGNGLNNQRANLRPCSAAQNACNRRRREGSKSMFYGVAYDPSNPDKPWRARAQINGVGHGGRRFRTELEAAVYRDEIARSVQGEFARLNFPAGAPEVTAAPPPAFAEKCVVCGEEFEALRRNRGKYCSTACRNRRPRTRLRSSCVLGHS